LTPRDTNDRKIYMQAVKRYLVTVWVISVLLASASCGPSETTQSGVEGAPNVLVFLIDDLGWRDIGVAGSEFYETPNIDRLAAQGMRFSQFTTASPVCSPTRASIMTGKHPARLNLTNWIGGEGAGMLLQAEYVRQLPLEEVTLGEAFQEAGYATGYIGKWHLGAAGFMPTDQGFDVSVAVNQAGQPAGYFYPYRGDEPSVWDVPDLADGADGEYLTDRLTDEALAFIDENQDHPFLLVLAHYAVHTPLQSKEALTAKYEAKAASLPEHLGPEFISESGLATTKVYQDHPVYAGMVESTDDSVGRVLDRLDALGLSDSTVVVFVSDNGGLSTYAGERTAGATSNLPLRAGKGWLYEGGVRAPLIIRWPGEAGAVGVSDAPASSTDLYPTLLEMAGLERRPEQHVDGMSLAPLLRYSGEPGRDALFWHFPHYHGSGNRPSGAVRVGDLKLIEWFEDGHVELYDLEQDPGETTDLSAAMPEAVEGLLARLRAWRQEVGARMPVPNPDWESER
jgi:arylsulfatase A-like enzyme